MKSIITLLLVLLTGVQVTRAQRNEIFSDRIATLQVVAGTDWLSPPVTFLNGSPIHIAFDDLTHDYHRYTYKLEHCEADWSVSDGLFESDYIDGFLEGNLIEDIQESLNTNVLYTHYHLTIPNEHCRLKMSGNYKVEVYDDNDDSEPMLTAYAGRIVNIHPSLLPRHGGKGMYGHYVHESVLASGDKQSGITIHMVTDVPDGGPIVEQHTCPVMPDDTPDTLAARVHQLEYAYFPQAIERLAKTL